MAMGMETTIVTHMANGNATAIIAMATAMVLSRGIMIWLGTDTAMAMGMAVATYYLQKGLWLWR